MLRRLTSATAALVLAFQLIFVGSGFTCARPLGGPPANSEMARMGISDTRASDLAIDVSTDNGQPCDIPMPAQCQTTAGCAPAAVASSIVASLQLGAVDRDIVRLTVLAPPARGVPPELPPPRA